MRQTSTSTASGGLENPTLERVLMEAHMIRALKHEHIIGLEDVFSDRNTLFLVMELVRGGDLFDRVVARGRYGEHEARVVMVQVLGAMQFMHDKNVAHRDMKPENILLLSKDSDTDVKITDFGLAKSSEDSGGLKTYCGTPHYFAPEVQNQQGLADGATYGFEADMWSVGVVAYVLLTGDYPWSGDHSAMCREIAAGQVNYAKHKAVWSALSPAAMAFVSRLIVLEPRARMTAAEALQHEWLDSVRAPPQQQQQAVSVGAEVAVSELSVVQSNESPGQMTSMPPPTAPARHSKGKKRNLDSVAGDDDGAPQRCVRSRAPSSSSGPTPMEVSHSTEGGAGRTRLPRKAKQISISKFCSKE
jgi:serine/threonine protein kinase